LEPKDLLSNWLAFGVDWVASDDDAPKVFHFPQGLFVFPQKSPETLQRASI